MKKEITAVCLLALILILSLLNIRLMGTRMNALISDVEAAEKLSASGEPQQAAETVQGSLKTWESWENYTHIMLRHSEIEMITQAYYELLAELQEGKAPAHAKFSWLLSLLADMTAKESITFKSVF